MSITNPPNPISSSRMEPPPLRRTRCYFEQEIHLDFNADFTSTARARSVRSRLLIARGRKCFQTLDKEYGYIDEEFLHGINHFAEFNVAPAPIRDQPTPPTPPPASREGWL